MTEGSRKKFYFYVSLMDYAYWAIGTALGSLAGAALSFNTAGMGAATPSSVLSQER